MDNRYKHILLSNDTGDRLELVNAPEGWNAQKFNLIRDMIYLGILKSISVEYAFVGDGFRFLQQNRLRFGMDADIIYRIYEKRGNKFLFEGKVNLENYGENRKFNRFRVDIVQSSFVQKFNNREDIKVNVLNTLSLDRIPITPPLLKTATFRGKEIRFYSESVATYQEAPDLYHHIWPFKLAVNGNPGVKEVSNLNVTYWIADSLIIEDCANNPLTLVENALYSNVLTEVQTINVIWNVNYTVVYAGSVSLSPSDAETNYVVFRMLKVNADNTVDTQLFFDLVPVRNGSSITLSYSYDDTLVMDPGQYLIWHVERWGNDLPIGFTRPLDTTMMDTSLKTELTYNSMFLSIEQVSVVSNTDHTVLLPHELFSTLVAQINGGTFYSETFGRIDLGYDVDGDGAYVATIPGTWLRGISTADANFITSMRDAFKSYSSVFCLGAIITDRRIQIDTLDKLFNNNIAADIGEVEELEIEPTKEFLFNSLKTGYPANEYEQENGRDEINTPYQFTNSFQSVKKELDTMSVYCADGYGIEFARRASIIRTGTQDSRYDEKIFLIDLIKDGDDLITRRLEDILFVSGIFSPETAINLRLAVGQNQLRWKRYLVMPLNKKDKVYFFQSKEKNAGLRLVTALGETNDGEDILMGNSMLFIPEEGKKFKCPLTLQSLADIMVNPLGLVKYTYAGETFHDYILHVESETDKNMSVWRALGTKSTPADVAVDAIFGNYIKYGDGLQDFVKYGDGPEDYIKYAD